jgi:predicted ribosome quality control (RQC) complex YloA/Tae2 family protein
VNAKPLKIPFDSFVLEAVVDELRSFVPAKVQGIRQPNEFEVVLNLYAAGKEAMLLLNCHPTFFRAHFVTKRQANQPQPPQFLSALRSRIDGGRLVAVKQLPGERLLQMDFISIDEEHGERAHRLVIELMGKHSNLILVDQQGKVVAAAKWVGKSKSSRHILPGVTYSLPPVIKPSNQPAAMSRFQQQLLDAGGSLSPLNPVLSPGYGAYPVSVAALGLGEHPRQTVSIALEQHYDQAIPAAEADALRHSLLAQLDRVILAREAALSDLHQAEAAGLNAGQWQRWGELVLAYGPAAPLGASTLQAWDYDGTELAIRLDPELDFKENATRYFEKARKAKARMGLVLDQIERLATEQARAASLRSEVELADRLVRLRELQDEARKNRWLTEQRLPTTVKEDRPYEGHRIRELLAPGGYTLLYGENAESNDYLTLRVAKPNDWWLHVRGAVSAHVVIQTRNQPDKVQKETLMYAAKIAVQNSPSKHAGYVAVDYTLKKYVRKPKSAPKGTALYTHEKTLHVES